MTKKSRRKKSYLGNAVQRALLYRLVAYWFLFLLGSLLVATILHVFANPVEAFSKGFEGIINYQRPMLIASLVLLPIFLRDMIRFSIRFVGPVVRLQNEVGRLADGEQVAPVKFRKHDYWHDLATQFNRLRDRVETNSPSKDTSSVVQEDESASEEPALATAD